MLRKTNCNTVCQNVCHLNTDDGIVTSKTEIVNTLAETFAEKSSPRNYSPKFRKFQNSKENVKLNFKSHNTEQYNKDFTLKELKKALKNCQDTAIGNDDISVFKAFADSIPRLLTPLFNQVWKTGKDSSSPANYRPIALTSCICKSIERMVNDRLVWSLEKNELIGTVQSGFRKQKGTLDHLIRLETFIREGFIKKEHIVSEFFLS